MINLSSKNRSLKKSNVANKIIYSTSYFIVPTYLLLGINQMQWTLEFLKCMELEHSYPECIGKIVNELEKQLIELYSKVGEKLKEQKAQKEAEKKDNNNNYSPGKSPLPMHLQLYVYVNHLVIKV